MFTQVAVADTFSHSTKRLRQANLCEFKDGLICRVSSGTARTTEKHCLEKLSSEELGHFPKIKTSGQIPDTVLFEAPAERCLFP